VTRFASSDPSRPSSARAHQRRAGLAICCVPPAEGVFSDAGQIGLFVAASDGGRERPLLADAGVDYNALVAHDDRVSRRAAPRASAIESWRRCAYASRSFVREDLVLIEIAWRGVAEDGRVIRLAARPNRPRRRAPSTDEKPALPPVVSPSSDGVSAPACANARIAGDGIGNACARFYEFRSQRCHRPPVNSAIGNSAEGHQRAASRKALAQSAAGGRRCGSQGDLSVDDVAKGTAHDRANASFGRGGMSRPATWRIVLIAFFTAGAGVPVAHR
jgi:hypothetical protein